MSDISGWRAADSEPWPELPLAAWQSTLGTLHMWLQIVGKIKLELVPFRNQWWNITLHLTSRGLTTGIIPYGERAFEIEFDFLDHNAYITVTDGQVKTIGLYPRSVARFYAEMMDTLAALDIQVRVNPIPVEVPHTISCETNEVYKDYDPEYVTRWWRIMLGTTMVLQQYGSRFSGKSSPPHFFWGSFDLAQTRHSGLPAEPPQGAPLFFQLAENEQNAACGFWPGNTSASGLTYGEPAFYAYTYPQPEGYPDAKVLPEAAYFDKTMGEFILRYEDVRGAPSPAQAILDFFESTYVAAADLAGWDRDRLEIAPVAEQIS
jgi:hypothetical protein